MLLVKKCAFSFSVMPEPQHIAQSTPLTFVTITQVAAVKCLTPQIIIILVLCHTLPFFNRFTLELTQKRR